MKDLGATAEEIADSLREDAEYWQRKYRRAAADLAATLARADAAETAVAAMEPLVEEACGQRDTYRAALEALRDEFALTPSLLLIVTTALASRTGGEEGKHE